jgi:hypothetical protein
MKQVRTRSDEEIEALAEAEREYYAVVVPEVRKRIAELRAEAPADFGTIARVGYLKECMTDQIVLAWKLMSRYERYIRRDRMTERFLVGEYLRETVANVMKLQAAIWRLLRPQTDEKGNGVTADMIARAREYPFSELHPFVRNMAKCPFHDDKTPSMSLKNNRARCWSCGESWDPIGFVMKKDGMTFHQSVRYLQ